jgi:hypothetical protein
VAERLGLDITRIRPLIKEGQLLAVRRGENKVLMVPADFIGDGAITKGLTGTLTVLKGHGTAREPRDRGEAPRAGTGRVTRAEQRRSGPG